MWYSCRNWILFCVSLNLLFQGFTEHICVIKCPLMNSEFFHLLSLFLYWWMDKKSLDSSIILQFLRFTSFHIFHLILIFSFAWLNCLFLVLLIGYPSLDVNSNTVLGVHVVSMAWQKCYTSLYPKFFKKFWIPASVVSHWLHVVRMYKICSKWLVVRICNS